MGELASYTLRLVIAAVFGVVACLLVGAALLLLVGVVETTAQKAAPEFAVIMVGLGSFAAALAMTRFAWARWLRPRDRKLEYWRRVAEEARSGAPRPAGTATLGLSVQLTPDGLAVDEASRRVEVKWSELREIRVRTFRNALAGPIFAIIKNDGAIVTAPQEQVSPNVLARMQQLPGFRNEALIEAMGGLDDAEFSCWCRVDYLR